MNIKEKHTSLRSPAMTCSFISQTNIIVDICNLNLDIYDYVYILISVNKKKTYTGVTSDIRRRLNEHNLGKEKSTGPYAPYKLCHLERHETLSEASPRISKKFFGEVAEWLKAAVILGCAQNNLEERTWRITTPVTRGLNG